MNRSAYNATITINENEYKCLVVGYKEADAVRMILNNVVVYYHKQEFKNGMTIKVTLEEIDT